MTYYSMKQWKLKGFQKSSRKKKMYSALLENKDGKIVKLHFGDTRYKNFQDKTGLNLYPKLIHGDAKRRKNYRRRHAGYIRQGFYSPGYFSYNYLW
jgi:hypothetical protein